MNLWFNNLTIELMSTYRIIEGFKYYFPNYLKMVSQLLAMPYPLLNERCRPQPLPVTLIVQMLILNHWQSETERNPHWDLQLK